MLEGAFAEAAVGRFGFQLVEPAFEADGLQHFCDFPHGHIAVACQLPRPAAALGQEGVIVAVPVLIVHGDAKLVSAEAVHLNVIAVVKLCDFFHGDFLSARGSRRSI